MGKKFCNEFFLLKKTFFTEKNINENVKIYISHLRNIFLCKNVCVTNKIYIFFKNTFVLQKNFFLIIKNIFVKTSL